MDLQDLRHIAPAQQSFGGRSEVVSLKVHLRGSNAAPVRNGESMREFDLNR